jgi:hypothetical protein
VLRTFACGLGKQPRQSLRDSEKKQNVRCGRGAKQRLCKFFIGLLLCATATFENIFWFCFPHCPPFLSRLLLLGRPLFKHFLKVWTHTAKSAGTGYGRLFPLRGESGGGHAPFLVRAFILAGSPRTPVRLLGRALTHV